MESTKKKWQERAFDVAVFAKGADGLLEITGGVLLAFTSSASLNHLVRALTQHELATDPDDFFANHLVSWAQHIGHLHVLSVLYLLGHGLAKILLMVAVISKRAWAFPVSLGFMSVFVIYELYQVGATHSLAMLGLTIFDLAVMFLVWREWRGLLSGE